MTNMPDNKDVEEFLHTLTQRKNIEIKLPVEEITTIDLSHSHLQTLPHNFHLPSLRELNLSHNKLTQVPECFFENLLPLLEILDLSFNSLRDFDRKPDCLLQLKVLNLSHNCFSNTPVWFLNLCCTSLKQFNYSQNKATNYNFISNNFDQHLGHLTKLELQNACLIDKDVQWLRAFSSLRYLDVGNQGLVHEENINNFRDLNTLFDKPAWNYITVLKISYLSLPFFPKDLVHITSLQELYISNNYLSWLPSDLSLLVHLKILDISDNQLVYISNEILELTELRVLLASGNQLEEIPYFPPSLEVFDLYNNIISTINVKNLNNLLLFDIDYNYVDMEESDSVDAESYLEKKGEYRRIYDKSYRFNCGKPKVICDAPSSVSSDESWESEIVDIKCEVTVDEDWDKDYVKQADISWSDNEFVGDERVFTPSSHLKTKAPAACDEDWMFADAD